LYRLGSLLYHVGTDEGVCPTDYGAVREPPLRVGADAPTYPWAPGFLPDRVRDRLHGKYVREGDLPVAPTLRNEILRQGPE